MFQYDFSAYLFIIFSHGLGRELIIIISGANKPDIAICNKKERQLLIFEGTVCNIGQIQERDKFKTEEYADLRASLKILSRL